MSGPAAGTVRTFIALELPADVKARLAAAAREVTAGWDENPPVRLVAEDSLHVTLRFLGRTSPAAAQRIGARLVEDARRCTAVVAPIHGLGFFPERGRVRVFWAGLELPAAFAELQAACEASARAEGFEPEERSFEPHVTLGRWREPAPRPTLVAPPLGHAALTQAVLFRSDLSPKGPTYTAMLRAPLGAVA